MYRFVCDLHGLLGYSAQEIHAMVDLQPLAANSAALANVAASSEVNAPSPVSHLFYFLMRLILYYHGPLHLRGCPEKLLLIDRVCPEVALAESDKNPRRSALAPFASFTFL